MNYVQLVLGAIGLLTWLLKRADTQQLIAAGEMQAAVKALQVQLAEVDRANKAREEARRRNAAIPADRSLPDDGFSRD